MMDNFIECRDIEQANRINLKEYSFVKHSDTKGYIFKIREEARKKLE